jgi:hypothetical protein
MVGAERQVRSGSTIFSYQVPYFYKNEDGLLYVEPQNDASYKAGKAKQLKEDWDEEEEGVVAEEEELGVGEEGAEAEVGTLFGGAYLRVIVAAFVVVSCGLQSRPNIVF